MTPETNMQIEALKRLEKGQPVHYEKGINFTYLSVDGKSIIGISDDNFFLDTAKLAESNVLAKHFDISSCRYALSETEDICIYTNYVKKTAVRAGRVIDTYKSKKKKSQILTSEKGNVYADKTVLKNLKVSDAELFTDEKKRFMYFVRDNQVYAVMILVQFCDKEGETIAD